MKPTKIVIIGLEVGGFIAAKTAKKVNPGAEITIVDEKEYGMFSPCGLPFVTVGVIAEFDELIHSLPTEKMDMGKLLKYREFLINPKNKVVAAVYAKSSCHQPWVRMSIWTRRRNCCLNIDSMNGRIGCRSWNIISESRMSIDASLCPGHRWVRKHFNLASSLDM